MEYVVGLTSHKTFVLSELSGWEVTLRQQTLFTTALNVFMMELTISQ